MLIVQNRKKTLNFTKSKNQNLSKCRKAKTENSGNEEESTQNLSRYSNSSVLFPLGNQFSERREEIKRLECKYKMNAAANDHIGSHSSHISASTANSSAVRTGMIVITGN
jgi:hypothetical protein